MIFWQSALLKAIHIDENLWNAWRAVKAADAQPGADGVPLVAFERQLLPNLRALQRALATCTYRPGAPKLFQIPKPNGAKRPIALLSVADRVVERAVYQAVSPVVDPQLHPNSHAFRPGRSTRTAVEHLVRLAGAQDHWFGHVDIAACFPSLAHWHLRRQLRRFIPGRDVRRLIHAFIAAAGTPATPNTGVLQGGALSPLLSNVYLDALDRRLDALGIRFVRYADNILFVGPTQAAVQAAHGHTAKGLRKIALSVNHEKTVTTHLRRGVAVLGYLLMEPKGHPQHIALHNLHPPQEHARPSDPRPNPFERECLHHANHRR